MASAARVDWAWRMAVGETPAPTWALAVWWLRVPSRALTIMPRDSGVMPREAMWDEACSD